jgi:hypothetical protein
MQLSRRGIADTLCMRLHEPFIRVLRAYPSSERFPHFCVIREDYNSVFLERYSVETANISIGQPWKNRGETACRTILTPLEIRV